MKSISLYLLKMTLFCQIYCLSIGAYQVGDVILLDLDCYSCQKIEDETFGPYSHSGVIVEVAGKKVVAQSLSKVHHVTIKAFLNFASKPALHLRPKEITPEQKTYLSELYLQKYQGHLFDHDFLWDNETYYCSEFIYKLLNDAQVLNDLVAAPMDFSRNYDFWKIYFHGEPPQGELGISPNDFLRSSDFYQVK